MTATVSAPMTAARVTMPAALLAIDPGPTHSALVRWDGATISLK
jgi:hypothetical protein